MRNLNSLLVGSILFSVACGARTDPDALTESDGNTKFIGGATSTGGAYATGGALRCWGSNYYGELGNGTTTASAGPVVVTGF
jgi:hypothetical protein